MTKRIKESDQTKTLFDKAVKQLEAIIDLGHVEDSEYAAFVIRVYIGYIKIRNLEVRESALKYAVSKDLAENVEALKATLKKQLPEYTAE